MRSEQVQPEYPTRLSIARLDIFEDLQAEYFGSEEFEANTRVFSMNDISKIVDRIIVKLGNSGLINMEVAMVREPEGEVKDV